MAQWQCHIELMMESNLMSVTGNVADKRYCIMDENERLNLFRMCVCVDVVPNRTISYNVKSKAYIVIYSHIKSSYTNP